MINRTNTIGSIESIEEKRDRLLKIVAESPYHQMKKDEDRLGNGYRWVFKIAFLRSVNQETGFEQIMNSKHFSEIEKDFLLFNMHRLKEIAEWPCNQFSIEVKEFKEANDV